MTRWRYKDSVGVDHEGNFEKFSDHGGSDITYYFRRDDGTLDLVSGSRLREAHSLLQSDITTAPKIAAERDRLLSVNMELLEALEDARPVIATAEDDPLAAPWQKDVRHQILVTVDAAIAKAKEDR